MTFLTELIFKPHWWNDRRKQLLFRTILGVIALAMLVEVVLVPGVLLRPRQRMTVIVAPTTPGDVPGVANPQTDHPGLQLAHALMTDPQTRQHEAEQKHAAQRRLLAAAIRPRLQTLHEQVGRTQSAERDLLDAFAVASGFGLDPITGRPTSTPTRTFDRLILTEPTAQEAYAGVRKTVPGTAATLAQLQAMIGEIEHRMNSDSFDAGDVGRIDDAIKTSQQAEAQTVWARRRVIHLGLLIKAQVVSRSFSKEMP